MNATDIIGWIFEGTYLCTDHAPETEEEKEAAQPIFADSETDSFSHCSECEALIPEKLTTEGFAEVMESFRLFLVRREGRAKIKEMWAEHVKNGMSLAAEEKVIIDLVLEACEENNVRALRRNVMHGGLGDTLRSIKALCESALEDK